ncbi:hypothetical protein [Pyxidicoccus trucidator]|uniref:hypothetical protein n=1 Tax=Pyxidicoccus trucidator TaxID=2709662 RepID=UPI0013D8F15E|nr:hypothetical protein [Pyxidicoccus trucidator]
MVRRAWVASFGVAVFLGAAGCSSETVENTGTEVVLPPDEETPPDVEPRPDVEPPPEEPDDVQEEPPPVTEEDSCPKPDLGRMPTEDLFDERPARAACELSPDGCDAFRPAHARREVPRPCQVRDTASPEEVAYVLGHDASGRLTSFDVASERHGRYDGYTYDACHRILRRGWGFHEASSYAVADWKRDPKGRLVERDFVTNFFNSTLMLERDERDLLVGAVMVPRYGKQDLARLPHQYTLDAEGRITGGTGTSFDLDGHWTSDYSWEEERRYDAAGELTEVKRTSAGQLLWLKELSQGRLVRYVSQGGLLEERWTYGVRGLLVHYEVDASEASGVKEKRRVVYSYGPDDRLLGADMTTWTPKDGAWTESQRFSAYRYAEDGRLLSRVDSAGPGPSAPATTYQYDYVCE